MHDDADFLRAILADPFDDAPRLLLADWLEDRAHESGGGERCDWCKGNSCLTCHGTGRIPDTRAARAEFIRLGCELAAWPIEKCDSIYPGCTVKGGKVSQHNHKCPMRPLAVRCSELVGGHGHDWVNINTVDIWPIEIRRGFVASISCTLAAFQQHAAEIFAKHPVTEVRLTDREPRRRRLGEWDWVRTYEDPPSHHYVIPNDLWYRIPGYSVHAWSSFDSMVVAKDALSRACVDYGRSLAGLPPMAWPAMAENELSGISG